jgi:tetratricopeptide (TPR) repeat protein
MKYFTMGALLFGCSLGTMAQTGTPADVDAVKALVKNKPADYDKQLKAFIKANKKNADNIVAMGRALMQEGDTAQAANFAKQALSAKKNFAPAYILLGDIASQAENGGGLAATNYQLAIDADPKNVDAYRKYAIVYSKIDPEGSNEKLEELRVQRPDIAVDAFKGRMNYNVQRYGSAISAYSNVPLDQLERIDVINYARALQLAQKFEESQRVVVAGLAKEPLNGTLNRFAMMNCNDLKNYAEAIKFANVLFTQVDKDSVKLKDIDYQNYGKALHGNGQFEEAIAKFNEALTQPAEDKSLHADLYKSISDSYKSLKDFPKAIESYKQFLGAKEDADATDWAGLGILQNTLARGLQGEEKIEALSQADKTFASLIEKFADAEEYGLFQRGRMNDQMDADLSKGLAKPYFERLADLINKHENLDESDKNRLFAAYSYLMRFNVKNKDSKAAYEYAKKLQELQPEDAEIKKVVETLSKAAN